jgi:hypothetical protein
MAGLSLPTGKVEALSGKGSTSWSLGIGYQIEEWQFSLSNTINDKFEGLAGDVDLENQQSLKISRELTLSEAIAPVQLDIGIENNPWHKASGKELREYVPSFTVSSPLKFFQNTHWSASVRGDKNPSFHISIGWSHD